MSQQKKNDKWTIESVSDEFLVRHAVKNDVLIASNIEMMKRLKNAVIKIEIATKNMNKSIERFNKSSNRWSLVLTILTVIMLIAVAFQIYLGLFYKP